MCRWPNKTQKRRNDQNLTTAHTHTRQQQQSRPFWLLYSTLDSTFEIKQLHTNRHMHAEHVQYIQAMGWWCWWTVMAKPLLSILFEKIHFLSYSLASSFFFIPFARSLWFPSLHTVTLLPSTNSLPRRKRILWSQNLICAHTHRHTTILIYRL